MHVDFMWWNKWPDNGIQKEGRSRHPQQMGFQRLAEGPVKGVVNGMAEATTGTGRQAGELKEAQRRASFLQEEKDHQCR